MTAPREPAARQGWRPKEIAESFGVPRATVYGWLESRLLAHVAVGGVKLVLDRDLQEFLAKHRVEARSRKGGA